MVLVAFVFVAAAITLALLIEEWKILLALPVIMLIMNGILFIFGIRGKVRYIHKKD